MSGLPPGAMLPAQEVLPSAIGAPPSRGVPGSAMGRGGNAQAGRVGSAPPPDYRRYRRRRRLAEASAGGAQPLPEASMALRASLQRCLVTNLASLANASRGGGRGGGASTAFSSMRPLRFCWQEACLRGGAAESWLRVHHYGRPPTAEQRSWGHPGYALERSGEPEEDTHALRFVAGSA